MEFKLVDSSLNKVELANEPANFNQQLRVPAKLSLKTKEIDYPVDGNGIFIGVQLNSNEIHEKKKLLLTEFYQEYKISLPENKKPSKEEISFFVNTIFDTFYNALQPKIENTYLEKAEINTSVCRKKLYELLKYRLT